MNTKLSLPNSCIDRLPFLYGCPIQDVDIRGNRIESLEGLPLSIKTLNAMNNYITIDGLLHPFPSLIDLNVQNNRINLFPNDEFMLCFPSLKKLNMSMNLLKQTAYFRDTTIEELYLDRNPLNLVSGLPQSLKHLVVDSCEITMIQSKLPPNIVNLEASYNKLRFAGLPFNWGTCLRELHLDHNRIEQFPRKLPDSLEILTLNDNSLTRLPAELPVSLHSLCVNKNKLRSIPDWKGKRTFHILLLDENCLVETPDPSLARIFSAEGNWDTSEYDNSQRKIRKCWKRYHLMLRLRHLFRTQVLKEELLSVSMMPERWQQVDTLDPAWFMKSPHHIHIDHHWD